MMNIAYLTDGFCCTLSIHPVSLCLVSVSIRCGCLSQYDHGREHDHKNANRDDAADDHNEDDSTSIVINKSLVTSAMPRMLSRMPFQMRKVPGMPRPWDVMVGWWQSFLGKDEAANAKQDLFVQYLMCK